MIETITVLTDDVDGKTKTNVSTVSFSIDQQNFEMELGTVNARKLREIFGPYIAVARKANGTKPKVTKPKAASNGHQPSTDLRQWAIDHGYDVKPKGRIPARVQAEYLAAVGVT